MVSPTSRSSIVALAISMVVMFVISRPAMAAIDFTPEVPFPGFNQTAEVSNNFIAEYIKAVFVYFIWTVGILAMFMVVYGGFKWVSAAGNPGQINDARETINNAIIGVIIALTSVLLLNTINPNFTKLGLPDISSTVQSNYLTGAAATIYCPPSAKQKCGEILKIGDKTYLDRNNQRVDEYCMGTVCEDGNTLGVYTQHICSLAQNDSTGYFAPGFGCIADIPIKPTDPNAPAYQNLFSVKAQDNKNILNIITLLSCGKIYPEDKWAGTHCASVSGDSYYKDKTVCYMIGLYGKVTDDPGNIDHADNILCAQN